MHKWWVMCLGVLLVGIGCDRSQVNLQDPKKVLEKYIERSFNINEVSDRKGLEELLTGPARTRLSAWSNDQFHGAFVENKRKFQKLAFKEIKDLSESEVNITYELVYRDEKKDYKATVTNRKLCYLVKEEGGWYIKNVRNIKELIEYEDEMSLP